MADISGAMDIASKIVDATNNTEQQNNSGVPQADTGDTSLKTVQAPTTGTIPTSQTSTNDQIVKAAQEGLSQQQASTQQETPITTGTTGRTSTAYMKELYSQVGNLKDFIKKLGYGVAETKDKLYVNNTPVDWASLGISKDLSGNYQGTLPQYEQLINNVKAAGYTTSLDFQSYAKELGANIGRSATNQYTVNNKEVDFSQYTSLGMRLINGQWAGTEEAYKKIIKDVDERSDKTLVDSLNEQGLNAKIINNELYINNKKVDWKAFGLKKVFANVVGTDQQYEQVAKAIETEGYNKDTLSDYAKTVGLQVQELKDNLVTINGQYFDLSQYKDLGLDKIPTLGWGGTEEAYKKIVEDAKKRSQFTLDNYVEQAKMSYQLVGNDVFINNRKISKDELNEYGIQVINGQMYGTDAQFKKVVSETKSEGYTTDLNFVDYTKGAKLKIASTEMTKNFDPTQFGIENINGQWVGSETQYKEALDFLQNSSNQVLGDYVKSSGNGFITASNGKSYINGKEITEDYLKSFGLKEMGGKIWGTQEQYDSLIQAVQDEGYTSKDDLGSYNTSLEQVGNNYTLDGKLVNLDNYEQYGLTYVDGKWYGPESAFQKVEEDVAARSEDTFAQSIEKTGAEYKVENDKVYVNGTDVTKAVNAAGMELVNGELVGTEAQYKTAQQKINDPYTYQSAFEEEIQNALDEIKNFQAYQTPQETLDLINKLVQTAQEKFSYNPAEDSALIIAQKEAERQVREGSAGRGMLYSSGTMETATRKMAELIPQFEQAAYNRFQAEQNRVINVMNAVMQWDQMQADQNMDQFTMITNKFNSLIDLDARGLEQFKVALDQRNADRQYELELQQFELDRRAQEIEQAWATVNQIGYVDEKYSAILGVPVGTKAAWLQQVQMEQQNAIELQRQQQAYESEQATKQAAIDRQLVEYKAQLDAANAEKLQAQENDYNRKLALRESNSAVAMQRPVVKSGSYGMYVRTLQHSLNLAGYSLAEDGSFGPKTLAALRSYQQAKGIPITGVCDAQTWATILNSEAGV
jgi:hypothetical protein